MHLFSLQDASENSESIVSIVLEPLTREACSKGAPDVKSVDKRVTGRLQRSRLHMISQLCQFRFVQACHNCSTQSVSEQSDNWLFDDAATFKGSATSKSNATVPWHTCPRLLT